MSKNLDERMNNLVDKIKSTFPSYDDLDYMINQLNGDQFESYGQVARFWLENFATKDNEIFNTEIAISLAQICEDGATDSSDYITIFEAVWNVELLNDKVWAKKLFEKAIDTANSEELIECARTVASEDYFNDKDLAKEIFEKVETSAEKEPWELLFLAETLAETGEIDWAKKILLKVEKIVDEFNQYLNIATISTKYIGDPKLTKKIFNKAVTEAKQCENFANIASSLSCHDFNYNIKLTEDADFHDKKLAEELYQKAIDTEEGGSFFFYLRLGNEIAADNWIDAIANKDLAKLSYKKAGEMMENKDDMKELIKAVKDNYEDKDWLKEIRKKGKVL